MKTTLTALSLALLFLCSCKNEIKNIIDLQTDRKVNYSDPENWIIRHADLMCAKKVDVFYVYPTVYTDSLPMNMDIDSSANVENAVIATKKQIGVFSDTCNVFAPLYRQMSMVGIDSPNKDKYFSRGLSDVIDAFSYYLKYLNRGRPFILAGHSQGSEVLLELMKTKKFTPYKDKLIAAYLIGYTVTRSELNAIGVGLAKGERDFGVVISYNTQSSDTINSPVLEEDALCVNPLNWGNDSAKKDANIGAVFFDSIAKIDTIIPHYTNAHIETSKKVINAKVLIADDPNSSNFYNSKWPFDEGVYHVYDYSFFYFNLKKNVNTRVAAYLENHHSLKK